MKSWFSIVIPTLNEEKNIITLLQSVLRQSYRPIEVIVVDDGSTDRTPALVKQYSDNFDNKQFRTVLVRRKKSGCGLRGPASARQLGINKAQGPYILLLDADFILSDKEIISQLSLALKNNHTARFKANTQSVSWLEHQLMLDNKAPLFRHRTASKRALGPLSGFAFRKWILEKFHLDTSLGVGEDRDLLGRIAEARLLSPTLISATGVKHLPQTFKELKEQKQWYGRTSFLWLKKYHSIKDISTLLPATPFVLFIGLFISSFLNTTLMAVFLATFLLTPLISFIKSPSKDGSRIIYLVFIRNIYSSFCYLLGIVQALTHLIFKGHIDASRGR